MTCVPFDLMVVGKFPPPAFQRCNQLYSVSNCNAITKASNFINYMYLTTSNCFDGFAVLSATWRHDLENAFTTIERGFLGSMRSPYVQKQWRHQTIQKDRTLKLQNKAPIRSLAAGPALPRCALQSVDRSTQRHDANPSMGQAKCSTQGILRLSVPTVTLAAHAADLAMLGHSHGARVVGPLRCQHHDDLHTCAEGGSGRYVKSVGFVD